MRGCGASPPGERPPARARKGSRIWRPCSSGSAGSSRRGGVHRAPAPRGVAAGAARRARPPAARRARAAGHRRRRSGRRARRRGGRGKGDRVGRLTGAAATLLVAAVGCRERAKVVESETATRDLVRRLAVQASQVTGLHFKSPVVVRLRTRDQVRAYIIHKFDQDLPPPELAGVQAAYRLFGLIPDSLDLRRTYVDLLTAQVAGYYDPDSSALFIPTDQGDPAQVRLVASHELVHALQDEYLPLDSIINQRRQNDRRSAAQAVLEGQATFYQISILMPEQHPESLPPGWFWRQRSAMALQQAAMPAFSSAPMWLRETLIFPYLGGADFVSWFARTHPRREPYGAAMPASTEQILHPDRYAAGDQPVALAFSGPAVASVRFEDGLGEFEIGLLITQLRRDSTSDAGRAAARGG